MDSLHSVLRTIRGETKARRDHLAVFREFLGHLDRIDRKSRGPEEQEREARRPSRQVAARWRKDVARRHMQRHRRA